MNERIQELIKQTGTDCSGKWISTFKAHDLAHSIIEQIETYIEESEGDMDYLKFLIDKHLKQNKA